MAYAQPPVGNPGPAAPPMGDGPPGAMPPGGAPPMPPGGAPPMGAGPEDVAAEYEAAEEKRLRALDATAPTPEGSGIKIEVLNRIVDGINKVLAALSAEAEKADAPIEVPQDIAWEAPEGMRRWQEPIEPAIFRPLVALSTLAGAIPEGAKHAFDPTSLVNDGAGTKIAGRLTGMAGDSKFIGALVATEVPSEGAPPSDGGGEPLSPEDEAALQQAV